MPLCSAHVGATGSEITAMTTTKHEQYHRQLPECKPKSALDGSSDLQKACNTWHNVCVSTARTAQRCTERCNAQNVAKSSKSGSGRPPWGGGPHRPPGAW
eukprot:3553387-Alexandrium_andersonii.AAC.1